ncbi:hypothetical protein A2V82_05520 [candidate division KSB1 bacterium RBG_16_48_16]|nr:MAG: hypothetical protein A2V82_05520 [candidate division KSB1 bacterium RBG_16_48_16]
MKPFLFSNSTVMIVLSVLLLFRSPSFCQTSETSGKEVNPDKNWALQFQIVDNFRLIPFNGSTISAQKYFSDRKAIRLGLRLAFEDSEDEATSNLKTPLQRNNDMTADRKSFDITMTAQIMFYSLPKNNVSLYFGIGPLLEYGYGKHEATTRSSASDTLRVMQTIDATRDMWQMGLAPGIGVEYSILKSVSLVAEYSSEMAYFKSTQKSSQEREALNPGTDAEYTTSNDKKESKGFIWGPDNVKFGVTVFF